MIIKLIALFFLPFTLAQRITTYTLIDVAKHSTENDLWIVLNGQVMNVTDFQNTHPGGRSKLFQYAGKSADFGKWNAIHKIEYLTKYQNLVIGTLAK
jgi:cytochrome b involved in lipid metabolism